MLETSASAYGWSTRTATNTVLLTLGWSKSKPICNGSYCSLSTSTFGAEIVSSDIVPSAAFTIVSAAFYPSASASAESTLIVSTFYFFLAYSSAFGETFNAALGASTALVSTPSSSLIFLSIQSFFWLVLIPHCSTNALRSSPKAFLSPPSASSLRISNNRL